MTQRFERQLALVGAGGQRALGDACVAVVGCGGLGSSVIMNLVSAGVGHLILIDGDVVSESNLNRQFIHAGSVGEPKVDSARRWIDLLDPDCIVDVVGKFLDHSDTDVLKDADIVVDCLDDPMDRVMLGRMCIDAGKVLVHGAIDSYHGQVAVIRPEDVLRMDHIYPKPSSGGVHHAISPAVSIIGSMQANEVINIIIGSDNGLRDEIMSVDLSDYSVTRYRIGQR